MTWAKIDDRLHSNPKWAPLSWRAKGLWAHAVSWCADRLTDGRIPAKMLVAWGADPDDAVDLCAAGLWEWHADAAEYVFHDWLEYNPSAESVLAKQAAEAERKRAARANGTKLAAVRRLSERSPAGQPPDVRAESERNPSYPDPDPDPLKIKKEKLTHLPAAEASHARDGDLALEGRLWWREVIGHDDYDHRAPKTRKVFEAFANKPAVERIAVAKVLQAERSKVGVLRMLTPGHVLDYWPAYVANNPPGRRSAGMSHVPSADEFELDKTRPAPWEM